MTSPAARWRPGPTISWSQLGFRVAPDTKVWQLSVGEQQRVEILRVLARGARTLILDEPTAVLTAAEAAELFKLMRSLVAGGRTVVFISHKLNEVLEVGDRITVLRNGERVTTCDAEGVTARELARLMTGEDRELAVDHRDTSAQPAVVQLRGVSARSSRGLPALHDVTLDVREGEILGIAGVSGNGQSELAEVLTGLRRVDAGQVLVAGRDLTNAQSEALRGKRGRQHPRRPDRHRPGALRTGARQRHPPPLPEPRAVGSHRAQAHRDDRVRAAARATGPGSRRPHCCPSPASSPAATSSD